MCSHPTDGHASSHQAHHFDTPGQQYDAARLGMWIFLMTEVLFFGGLFCAYAVFRANHPEIFVDGHHFLDKPLGAANTVILIFSSLTMALAVRAAQLGHRRRLIGLLAATLLCGMQRSSASRPSNTNTNGTTRIVPGQARIANWFSGDAAPAPRKEFRPDEAVREGTSRGIRFREPQSGQVFAASRSISARSWRSTSR